MVCRISLKNKKGILMPEAMKIILAVIGLVLLIYLLVSLYGVFQRKTRIDQANALLDEIDDMLKWMTEKNLDLTKEILLLSPQDWYLVSGSQDGSVSKLCICPEANMGSVCEREGVCRIINKNIFVGIPNTGDNLEIKINPKENTKIYSLAIEKIGTKYYLYPNQDPKFKGYELVRTLNDFLESRLITNFALERNGEAVRVWTVSSYITHVCEGYSSSDEETKKLVSEALYEHFKTFFSGKTDSSLINDYYLLEVTCNFPSSTGFFRKCFGNIEVCEREEASGEAMYDLSTRVFLDVSSGKVLPFHKEGSYENLFQLGRYMPEATNLKDFEFLMEGGAP